MEGPLVSDTTELLSDAAAPASEDSLTGHSAVGHRGNRCRRLKATGPSGR